MVFKTDGNGRVKLTEEEKETFASEGLPLPSRIPLTKVIMRLPPVISYRNENMSKDILKSLTFLGIPSGLAITDNQLTRILSYGTFLQITIHFH